MKSKIGLVLILLCGSAVLTYAQDPAPQPQVPEDAFSTRELIAWSSVQKPQPTPQPLPPPDKAIPQPDQQRTDDAKSQPGPSSDQNTPKTFVGTLVRQSDKYLLKVSSGDTYQLENAGDARQYENKSVKVVGDLNGNTIRVTRIEILS